MSKEIVFFCDMCGERIKWSDLGEPKITYEAWRYTDAAGGTSSASNQIHICAKCARKGLSLVLTGRKTIEQTVELFASRDKCRVKR